MEFSYTPDGHRAMKKEIPKTGATEYTYYSRDAQGNELATYLVRNDSIWLEEVSVFGTSKLGVQKVHQFLNNQIVVDTHYVAVTRGQKRYELSNHLGNVLAVVNDKHKNTCTTTVKYFAELMQAYDYSPFGAILPNRLFALETRTVTKPGLLFRYNNDFNDGTTQGYVANGGSVKNVNSQLYMYGTGSSKGCRRDFSGLTVGTTYNVTFTISDSIPGHNTYQVYLIQQPGGATINMGTYATAGTYSLSFTMPSGISVVQLYINGNGPFPNNPINFYVDNVTMTYAGMVTVQEPVDNYRFGFNGQEKDNEVAGTGNSNTAQFWQYDGRLGRRWNVDPKPEESISSYACFRNSPVLFPDPLGDRIRSDKLDKDESKKQGKVVEVEPEKLKQNQETLAKSLSEKTGLTISFNTAGLMEYAKDGEGNPIINGGSEDARNDLIKGIEDESFDYIIQWHNGSSEVGGAQSTLKGRGDFAGFVKIDIGDFSATDNKTFDIGMVFLHEYQHGYFGLKDDYTPSIAAGGDKPDLYGGTGYFRIGYPGQVEIRVNTYRQQLGYPLRRTYEAMGGRVLFSETYKYLDKKGKEKTGENYFTLPAFEK